MISMIAGSITVIVISHLFMFFSSDGVIVFVDYLNGLRSLRTSALLRPV